MAEEIHIDKALFGKRLNRLLDVWNVSLSKLLEEFCWQ